MQNAPPQRHVEIPCHLINNLSLHLEPQIFAESAGPAL